MRARAVIGANFGDEGKGLLTDYLCAIQGSGVVVRFNGGAQAGHTVVLPSGERHVFSHWGSGTLWGTPTFLSQFFLCNPIAFLRETGELSMAGVTLPPIFAHPSCLVTTFADMMINQSKEDSREATGKLRHGSTGMGIHETMQRSQVDKLKITMGDLWDGRLLEDTLQEICTSWYEFRTGGARIEAKIRDKMIVEFISRCKNTANIIHPAGIHDCKPLDPVFEGAQGLLLDAGRKEFWPHVTHSWTGIRNVRILCEQMGVGNIDAYYVSRTYLTRHGAGPLPGEDKKLRYHDDTNVPHPYQGELRFAPLQRSELERRIAEDHGPGTPKIVLTHCDQLRPEFRADYYSFGPTRNDVRERLNVTV